MWLGSLSAGFCWLPVWTHGGRKHGLKFLKMHHNELLEFWSLHENSAHLIRVEPLDPLIPVDLDVVPRLDDERRRSHRLFHPPLECILHLKGGLDMEIECRDEISEPKVL